MPRLLLLPLGTLIHAASRLLLLLGSLSCAFLGLLGPCIVRVGPAPIVLVGLRSHPCFVIHWAFLLILLISPKLLFGLRFLLFLLLDLQILDSQGQDLGPELLLHLGYAWRRKIMGSLEPEEIFVIILFRESRLLCLGQVSEPGEIELAPQVELPRRRVPGVDAELIERFDCALRVVFP